MTIARIPSAGTPSAQLPPRPVEPALAEAGPWSPKKCTAQLDDDAMFPTRCAEFVGHSGAHKSSSYLGVQRVSWETPEDEGGAA